MLDLVVLIVISKLYKSSIDQMQSCVTCESNLCDHMVTFDIFRGACVLYKLSKMFTTYGIFHNTPNIKIFTFFQPSCSSPMESACSCNKATWLHFSGFLLGCVHTVCNHDHSSLMEGELRGGAKPYCATRTLFSLAFNSH